MREPETTLGGDRESFPETVWSSLLGSDGPPSPAREAALNQLAGLYWRPVYKYLRTSGGATIEDAKDLTQEFFGYLLEDGVLAKYDREKGRFRSFLKAVLSNFLSVHRRDASRLKRGGGRPVASLDVGELETAAFLAERQRYTPDQIFDREWTREILSESLAEMRRQLGAEGGALAAQVYETYHGIGPSDGSSPMAIRRIPSDPNVFAAQGRVAIARGPIVYCLESNDNSTEVHHIVIPPDAALTSSYDPSFLGGVVRVTGSGLDAATGSPTDFTMIPYAVWDNRTHDSSMTVMIPETPDAATDRPDRGRAGAAVVTYSYKNASDTEAAANDGIWPHDSNDQSIPRFTWWSHQGTQEWIAYEFSSAITVWRSDLFWFSDAAAGGGCDFPESFSHEYWDGASWQPLVLAHDYAHTNDLLSTGHFTIVRFNPVSTTKVRLSVQLKPGKSGGILEWRLPE